MMTTKRFLGLAGIVAAVSLMGGVGSASAARGAAKGRPAVAKANPPALHAPSGTGQTGNVDQVVSDFEVKNPPRAHNLDKPSGKAWWKAVSHLWDKVVDWIISQITKGINFVKQKIFGKIKEMFTAVKNKVVAGAKALLEKTFEGVIKPVIEMIPFEDIDRIAELMSGTKLTSEGLRQKVFDLVMAYVRPHIKPRVMEVFKTAFMTVKQFIETGVTSACAVVSEVPFVGGVLGGAILIAFSFLFDFTVNAIVTELLHVAENLVLKPLAMKLMGPFMPTIAKWLNKALQITGLGKVLAFAKDAWTKVKDGAARVKALTGEAYQKAKNISAGLQKQLDEAAQEKVVAEHELNELLGKLGATGLKL
ncbi:MAG: hypothetical protein HYY84_14810 [Deltaproteobacteria bacterium]|nr:hypothetical protein [Deltaproteobacteria bacterium]